jgi:hypothetical protein
MTDGPVTGDLAMFNAMGGLVDSGIPASGGGGAAITGVGTTPHLPRFTAPTTLANSAFQDAGATTLTVSLLIATNLFDNALVIENTTTDSDHGIAITAAPTKTALGFIEIDGIGDDPGTVPQVTMFRARGVGGALTNILAGDNLGFWDIAGQGAAIITQGVRLAATATEDWTATFGTQFGIATIPTGGVALVTALEIDGFSNTVVEKSLLEGHNVAVPLTGDIVAMTANLRRQILNPAGVLATLTVQLPDNPRPDQVAGISTTQQITALTVTPGAGAVGVLPAFFPIALAQGGSLNFIFNSTNWYISP